jgi:Flp pilus assembly protein TadG
VKRRFHHRWQPSREGAVLVETAVVVPVFALFLVGIIEFGHAYMVLGVLNAAAKQGARHGAVDGVSTSHVDARIRQILSSSMNPNRATIFVKDGSVFDTDDPNVGEIDYSELSDIELSSAETRQLYIVRIEVPYENVALLPPFWAKGITLKGQSVMRHE